MIRILAILVGGMSASFFLNAAAAQEEGPVVLNKTVSQWVAILQKDPLEKNRRGALIALGQAGLESRKVVPAVAEALGRDGSPALREAAAATLGRLAYKATDLLTEAKGNAAVILADDRKKCLDSLMEALRGDKEARVRTTCATGLGRLGPDAGPAVAALTSALKDKDDVTRAAAAEALGRIGDKASEAIPALLDCLKDKKANSPVRVYAAYALGRTSGEVVKVVPALTESLGDVHENAEVRKTAAESLGLLKNSASPAVGVLLHALTKEDKAGVDLRRECITALDRISPLPKSAAADLKPAVKDEDKFVRSRVLHVLGEMGPDGADALPDIIGRLKDDLVLEVRLAAIEALGAIGIKSKEVTEALNVASRSSIAAVRNAAKDALQKLQAPMP